MSDNILDRLRRFLFGTTPMRALIGNDELSDRALRGVWRGDWNYDEVLLERGMTLAVYDRMMLDDKIAGLIRFKKSLCLSCDWEIKGDDPDACEWVKETLESIKGMSFVDVIDNLLDAWIYGFKLAEVVWGYRDGKVVPLSIKPKWSQRLWFHNDGFGNLEYAYIMVDTPGTRVDLTRQGKFILFVHPYPKDGIYYGQSDLTSIYREWKAKDALVKWRTIALMKFGSAAIKANYEQKQRKELDESFAVLKDWQEFGILKIPSKRDPKTGILQPLIDISLLESASRSADNYTAAIQELDKAMARKMLVPDQMGLGETRGGSFNNHQMQFDIVLADVRREHARICDALNTQLITPLCEFNGLPICKLHFVGLSEGLTTEKTTQIKTLLDGGAINKREPWIREFLGVPPMDPELQAQLDAMAVSIAAPQVGPDGKPVPPDPKGPNAKATDTATEAPPATKADPASNAAMTGNAGLNPKPAKISAQRKTPAMNYLDRINYKRVQGDLDAQEKPATDAIVTATDAGVLSMIGWLKERKILDGENIDLLDELRVPVKTRRSYQWVSETLLGRSLMHGKKSAAEELPKVRHKLGDELGWSEIDATDYLDKEWLKSWLKEHRLDLTESDIELVDMAIQNSFTIAGVMEQDLLKVVKQAIFGGYGKMTGSVLAAKIREQVGTLTRAHAQTVVRTNSSKYYNNGRYAEFAEAGDLVVGGQWSAILDDQTTPFCEAHHGKFLLQSNPLYGLIPPAHFNCRSLVVAVMAGDDYEDDWNDVPANCRDPQEGFGI
jgi:SPP1 gp7 family putative phage head morphogenesis protein